MGIEIHINNGDVNKAIREVKFLYNHDEDPGWYFALKNLFVLNNKLDEASNLEEKADCYRSDIVSSIHTINKSIPNSYKVEFIENYVRSKAGTPSFICLKNKGRGLGKKSSTEVELLTNPNLYIRNRKNWYQSNNVPDYIKSLYSTSEIENISKLFEYGAPIIKATKVVLSDFDNGFVSIKNGQRKTIGQPENAV
ncbi:hypothetical protein [Vibrio campbellii]|uniref:Uncharacterized protein n=1 Tax=Vibrio campbellii (strain ATCC BAA-1116) TaxID=2902295 RepID=A7N7F1_VIBC1|nr:hypothetical protein [Vibrio campbellii]ABU73204.1 hypothetical protein VIBHAR_05298 [Vibrio campbellii ATCC BAA-1116]AGU98749.1 hypothetical protein M892_24855 [Vibrio campbellii ATCC BAA-1116]MBT0124667.1 hypothetical protein [Vibrio campbellii]MBT0139585.1 hypothetical protein [Vibrio campbellii]MBT0144267.1 hypothetical protein [Vibrio campbellii]